MDVRGKGFSVVGMGKSGLAAARALARLGADVLLSDRRGQDELSGVPLDKNIKAAFGGEVIRPGDVAVLSPGIPPHARVFRLAERLASEVMSEVELFFRLYSGRMVAVTGTDGKSTVTTLIAHILSSSGFSATAAGNLGNPLCDLLAAPPDVVVAEVSCFQLITCSRFRPEVAVVTNLAEDHIEYHGSFGAYVRAKARIVQNQAAGDCFVRNLDDPILVNWLRPGDQWTKENGQRVLDVSRHDLVRDGACAKDGVIYVASSGGAVRVCRRSDIPLPGEHNTENALLAIAACTALGVGPDALARALATYKGLPHRIERVREVDGVVFYNDSKATNPHAAITALRAFDEPVVLIAGGHEKGLSFQELAAEVGRRARAVVLVGECAGRMQREFSAHVPMEVCPDLNAAVRRAFELARPVRAPVLFSPGASSYDQFSNFEERGDRFREVVLAL